MLGLVVLSILMMWVVCAGVCAGVGALVLRVVAGRGRSSQPTAHSGQWEEEKRKKAVGENRTGEDSRFSVRSEQWEKEKGEKQRSSDATLERFSFSEAFWMGLAGCVAMLEVYHFVRAVDWVAAVVLAGLGAWGLVVSRGRWRAGGWGCAEGVLVFGAAAIVALRSAAPCEHYDTGLYGAQAVRWFTTYALVPGLGNVIGQMGFNSSVFLCVAALEQGALRGVGHHLFVGMLVAAVLGMSVRAGMRVWRGENLIGGEKIFVGESDACRVAGADWFLTLLFVTGAIAGAMGKLSGTNTDLPTTMVSLVAAYMLLRGLEGAEEEARERSLVIAMILFSVAVTFKISSVVFAFCGWMVAFVALWRMSGGEFARRKRVLACAVVISGTIVAPWMARGLVLTGYPFFPSSAIGIAVDWKVPAEAARVQLEFAQSFARIPQIPLADTSGWRWLRPWLRELVREREGFLIPVFFMVAGAVVAMWRGKAGALPRWLWVVPAAFAGLVFWFFGAPAMRFGEPIIWSAGATLGAFAAVRLLAGARERRLMIFVLVVVTAWAAHPRLLWGSYFRPSLGVRRLVRLPEAKVELRQTASGLGVYVPVETNQCWDAPLPCSPYLDPSLRLRQAGSMKDGFAVDASMTERRTPSQ
jgi:hypothetical protein